MSVFESAEDYATFEDRFRGKFEDIKERVRIYLPLVTRVLAEAGLPSKPVCDLGCGRGEWLEVLREAGVDAYGCDNSAAMAARCAGRGLRVEVADALVHLQTLPDGALAAVSGFHIVEHLPLDDCESLLRHAHRALAPGGIVIFETPNPENVGVGGHWFYLDPTHVRPLPPELLRYMTLVAGFDRAEVVRLHPDPRLNARLDDALTPLEQDVALQLFGPMDYSVVALKYGAGDVDEVENEMTNLAASGVVNVTRAPSRAIQLSEQVRALQAQNDALKAENDALKARSNAIESEKGALQTERQALRSEKERLSQQVARGLQALEQEKQAHAAAAHERGLLQADLTRVWASKSWKITAPLRRVDAWAKRWTGRG